MRKVFLFSSLLLSLFSFAQSVSIIPQPSSLTVRKGNFILSRTTTISVADEGDRSAAEFLNLYLQQVYGFQLAIKKETTGKAIRLFTKKFIKAPDNDAYTFESTATGINIEGDTYAGTFYGIQSLLQLLPIQKTASLKIPAVSIQDQPRFAYRGLHLDVSRHFFPVSFVKRYIDYIALHKMNYFHWHLTDDQGWRIEIKKYPRLTEIGGYRNGTIIGRYPGTGNDGKRYGGYYTQEEIKDVVAYAGKRFITVVPEIELPGHASAAIAAFPILSCFPLESTQHPAACAWSGDTTGKQVQQTWGVFDDVFCAGKESTFSFLQDVMDEVLPLFPSKMIHVGGDECPKANWKRCPDCQKRMKDNNLKDEHELQSYFIQRMEKYLNEKGRNLIGWDEILEGGLAPNAAVMSWRGEEGGIAAAKEKHQVVMTPGAWMYFDHSQSQQEDSVTIGGYTTLEKVYGYEPLPAALEASQQKYILGAQANLWSEYMKNSKKVEYMLFPRMSALSEVLWSPKEKKNWPDFEKRMQLQFKRYDLWKVNSSKAYFDIKATAIPGTTGGVSWQLETKLAGSVIMYKQSTGGSTVSKLMGGLVYKKPITVKSAGTVTAWTLKGGQVIGNPSSQQFIFNKATGKKVTLLTPVSNNYPGEGEFTVVNGIVNDRGLTRTKEFIGFEGTDAALVIDLGSSMNISTVSADIFDQRGSRIFPPYSIEALVSDDGQVFQSVGKQLVNIETVPVKKCTVSFATVQKRYVKLILQNHDESITQKTGNERKSWLFIHEIEIN